MRENGGNHDHKYSEMMQQDTVNVTINHFVSSDLLMTDQDVVQ